MQIIKEFKTLCRSVYRVLLNWVVQIAFKKDPLRVHLARYLLQKTTRASYTFKLFREAVPRPYYGLPIYYSLKLAKSLGYNKVSIIEFGIAGGNGLVNIEYHVKEIKKIIDIDVEIYGFDTASGLPKPKDYRDTPYQWKEGFYKMDIPALKSKLQFSKLVLGEVKKSLESFECAPVACVMFDLDYYSSTVDALEIFKQPHLPRVFCYFDDVVGNEVSLYNEFTGELLAIDEFNQKNDMKLLKYRGIGKYTAHQDNLFALHDFKHPEYNTYINFEDDGSGCSLNSQH